MMRRFLLACLVLHVLYVVAWIAMDRRQQLEFERYVVATAEVIAAVFYLVLIVAFWEAQKTRLNAALAIQKLYWVMLIIALALPFQIGLIVNNVPYRTSGNPHALWDTPGWLRTYIWMGIAISIIGVLYEFWNANWGASPRPWQPGVDPDRRVGPKDRRKAAENG